MDISPVTELFDAGEPRVETIDAGFAHQTSTDQQLHKSSAGAERGSGDHRDDDHSAEIPLVSLRLGSEPALLDRIFGSLGKCTVDARYVLLQV
jgi:hypothetical protein